MPGNPLDATFGVRTLSDMITTFARDDESFQLLNVWRGGRRMVALGDVAEWDEVQMHRHLAPFVGHKSPSPRLEDATRINRVAGLAHLKLHKDLDGRRLFVDRAAGSLSDNARQYIAEELADLKSTILASVERAIGLIASTGSLAMTAANFPGTTLPVTVAFAPTAYTFAAAWNNPGSLLLSEEIPAMQAAFLNAAGVEPALALLNDVSERYLRANAEIRTWAINEFGESVLLSGLGDGKVMGGLRLGGMDWKKITGRFVPQGGAAANFMNVDRVFLLPDAARLRDTIALIEGYGIVPTTLWGSAEELGIARAPTPGFYAYSERTNNPVGVRIYAGYVFLPVILFPAGTTLATIV